MPIAINGSGSITGISAGGLPDGIIQAADLASGVGGKILQVVSSHKVDLFSTTSPSFVDITGLSRTITPIAASSKINIIISIHVGAAQYVVLGKINEANFGHVVAASPTMTGDVTMSSTGFLKVPVGNNAQQPGQSGAPSAAAGQFRYNSDTGQFEGYTTSWGAIGGGGGATGGGTEAIFHENENQMDQNYTIGDGASNINAGVFGPLTINAVLTIPSGSVVSIV